MEKIVSSWPDQKKLAVMVTVMFEVWSEGKAPPYSPMTTSLKPGTRRSLGHLLVTVRRQNRHLALHAHLR